jgi:pseudaminic acid biosynthesis-associated methylase
MTSSYLLPKQSFPTLQHTQQEDFWAGDFGREYTDRNSRPLDEWNEFYRGIYGHTKLEMNAEFIGELEREARILEVGCNTGMQLVGFQAMGFSNLYGIELQHYAVEKARNFVRGVNILQGSGFDMPFKDNYFDLVCTNGVLIHIAPEDLPRIMGEMVRTSKRYIMGYEYFAPDTMAINYRGNEGFLWKTDFARVFLESYPELRLVKQRLYPYINDAERGNQDVMFLLEKVQG